ncbi:MAG: hypothetical protein V7720_00625 [Halioglobus sp.]
MSDSNEMPVTTLGAIGSKATPVPIGSLPLPPSILTAITAADTPSDDRDSHVFFRPLRLGESSPGYVYFQTLVDHFLNKTKGGRRPSDLVTLKRHWEYMLLNLSLATLQRSWILVALSQKSYSSDTWLKHHKLKYTATKTIVDYLQDEHLVDVRRGRQYKNNPSRTRLFPSKELQQELIALSLNAEEPIEPPYLTINEPSAGYGEVIGELPDSHPDMADMTLINNFLRGHRWACKGPVRLVYKHNPFSSGRLVTAFQSLPDRRMRVRISTLIDGKPICEVDFNANHLRLNLAVFNGEDAGETPYEDIRDIAGDVDRNKVKLFITRAMGADSELKAALACRQEGISQELFNSLKAATLQRYPNIRLFDGFGIHAQSLEGQILKDVMLAGVRAGKVVLPVHDAVAVVLEDSEWAQGQMLEAWASHANSDNGTARARVKVDYGLDI